MAGFIYLWYDKKHKRYYLGKHWGSPDDGYICSSKWMKRSYLRRPQDFKRRILQLVSTTKRDLTEAERQWGSLIAESELGTKYYNLKRPGADGHWSDTKENLGSPSMEVRERISRTQKARGHEIAESNRRRVRKPLTEDAKKRISESSKGKVISEEARRKMSESAKLRCSRRSAQSKP